MSTTTTPTITDEQINRLANESAEGGDLLQLAICERALDRFEARTWRTRLDTAQHARVRRMSVHTARVECARVMAAAQAMVDA